MAKTYLIDTGPIVAAINKRDKWHSWAEEAMERLPATLYTCEAVISEAYFLLKRTNGGREALLGMLSDGLIQIPWQLSNEIEAVRDLLLRYKSRMALADACLVRMAEQFPESIVFTTDRKDFVIYRMNRKQPIPTLMPDVN